VNRQVHINMILCWVLDVKTRCADPASMPFARRELKPRGAARLQQIPSFPLRSHVGLL
jgi:hypothetical protein